MKIFQAKQVDLFEIQQERHDAIIVSSGYESRATYLANLLSERRFQRQCALAFTDRIHLHRQSNDRRLREIGYELILASGNSEVEIQEELESIFELASSSYLSIVVDYSCMTRSWYASIIRHIVNSNTKINTVHVYFSYTPSLFSPPPLFPTQNSVMEPITGFCHPQLPYVETALIMGLGYDPDRAAGLFEYIEAAENFAFYTNPALDSRFTAKALQVNRSLIERLKEDRLIPYPAGDLHALDAMLTSLCLGLSEEYRVVLAPLGPKPFSLLCLLLSIRFQMFDVWRVSAGERERPVDREPIGGVICCKVTFTKSDPIHNIFSS